MLRIGLISDTHNLLRPAAKEFLRGCDHIIHGGDITEADILEELASLAPITAVRGNNDWSAWAENLRETEQIKFEEICVFVIHDLADLNIEPHAAVIQVVVSGHSHQPLIENREGVLFVNPGSAGPRRFKLPISMAELIINGNSVSARIVELEA
ncbi:MAG: metallophosphoesterase family protein [Burkholderiaceae bacterium]